MPLKYNVFENRMENVSIIFSKVSKILLKFVLIFFQCNLKKQNDAMIQTRGPEGSEALTWSP